eukprot:31089-Chlamydomonas_euryale.AAC.6
MQRQVPSVLLSGDLSPAAASGAHPVGGLSGVSKGRGVFLDARLIRLWAGHRGAKRLVPAAMARVTPGGVQCITVQPAEKHDAAR